MSKLITDPDLTPEDVAELRDRARKLDPTAKKGTRALARAADVAPAAVNLWLRGETTPNEVTTAKLLTEYGAPSRFGDCESVVAFTHRRDGVTLAFTFIGDSDAVSEAVDNIRQQVMA